MTEKSKQLTKEYWRQKYQKYVAPLKKISMKRNCLKCDKEFTAHGVPDGVRYIRICLTCKHSGYQKEVSDRKAGYVTMCYDRKD